MVINERSARQDVAVQIAKEMMVAARTAPKAKGVDIIEIGLVEGLDLEEMAKCMEKLSAESGMKFLLRDANNIRQAQCVVIIGTKTKVNGLNCGYCGYPTCAEKPEANPCELNSVDVGIALGSACSKACDYRVDTRVMFSAGWAATHLKLLGDEVGQIFAIPVSIDSKNPFFDRK